MRAISKSMAVRDVSPRRGLSLRLAMAAAVATLALLTVVAAPAALAQSLGGKKLPGISKIESKGSTDVVFTGGVQMLNVRSKVLEVSTADGSSTAIFPITKKVRVASIDGRKLKLAALTPGSNVIVHYRQEGGRRIVQKIVLVSKAPVKKAHSAS